MSLLKYCAWWDITSSTFVLVAIVRFKKRVLSCSSSKRGPWPFCTTACLLHPLPKKLSKAWLYMHVLPRLGNPRAWCFLTKVHTCGCQKDSWLAIIRLKIYSLWQIEQEGDSLRHAFQPRIHCFCCTIKVSICRTHNCWTLAKVPRWQFPTFQVMIGFQFSPLRPRMCFGACFGRDAGIIHEVAWFGLLMKRKYHLEWQKPLTE